MSSVKVVDSFALTPVQLGMVFHHVQAPRSGVDIEQLVCTLKEEVDADALFQSFDDVVRVHPALRTRFRWQDVPEPEQQVLEEVSVERVLIDHSDLDGHEQEQRLHAFLREDRVRGFDLAEAPLCRVALLRFGPQDYRFVCTFPHILLDGGSFPRVVSDLFASYAARVEGRTAELTQAPVRGASQTRAAAVGRSG
jgi:NRPS condensation-like uncharacterized protein